MANGTVSCGNYICQNNACKTTCATSNDCSDMATLYCVAPNCVSKKSNGGTCSSAGECLSGKCIDGRCCNSDCTGTCMACNVAGNVGTCTNIPSLGNDDNPVCGGGGDMLHTCNGSAECLGKTGAPCTMNSECLNNNCLGNNTCN